MKQRRIWSALWTPQNRMAIALIGLSVFAFSWVQQSNINLFTKTGLSTTVEALGWAGSLVYMGVLALSVVVSQVPGLPLACAAGAVWGGFLGGVYSVIGGFLAARREAPRSMLQHERRDESRAC
jgi:uncharacterized membrane protein YdjX (TVP38/TMEM64 family)